MFALSLLGNLGVSTVAVLVFFRPAFRQAQTCFSYQQELEQIRADLRSGAWSEGPTEAAEGMPAAAPSPAPLVRLKETVESEGLAELLGPANDRLSSAVRDLGASTQPVSRSGHVGAGFGEGSETFQDADRALTEAIVLLGDRREAAITRSARTQSGVMWILIANTCLGAFLCFIGLESVRGWVVHPVRALRQATDRFRQGDFKARVAVARFDELGELGQELNHMAERITDLRQRLIDTERHTAAVDMVHHLETHIRPPLARMKSLAANSLAADRSDSQIAACQERILTTIERFEEWLGDLTGMFLRPALRLEPTSIDEIVSSVLSAVRPTLEKRQVTVRVDREPGLPEVRADRMQIEQALIALVTNAAEASAAGQAIELRARRLPDESDAWELEVEDHGSGIPEEHLDKIFLPFFTTKPDGNGIGLELIREVVRMHSGRIAVESAVGKGTRFRISMPVSPGG